MRNVTITVDSMGRATTDSTQLGYSGEHNAVQLTVLFNTDVRDVYSQIEFFRIVIDGMYSDKLYLDDNKICYTVPQSCMKPPAVHCQLVGYKSTDSEPEVIIKSEVVTLNVERSEVSLYPEDGNPSLIERAMEKCDNAAESARLNANRSEASVYDAMNAADRSEKSAALSFESAKQAGQHAESASKNAEVLAKAVYDYRNVANALRRSTRGKRGTLKDVSPLEHEVKIKMTADDMGIFGVNENVKTVEFNQKNDTVMLDTPSDSVHVILESGGIYTASGIIPLLDGQDLTQLSDFSELAITPTYGYSENITQVDLTYTVTDKVLSWVRIETLPQLPDAEPVTISGSFALEMSGQKITGFCQVYGLDEDNPASQYPENDTLYTKVTVYDKSTSDITLTVGGKNFLKPPFANAKTTIRGVTFTPNADGTVVISGKNDGTGNSNFAFNKKVSLPAGTYAINSGNENCICNAQIQRPDGTLYYKFNTVFTLGEGENITNVYVQVVKGNTTEFDNVVVKPQIETGPTITEFEPYIEPLVYTPEADGTVKGVKSIYPSMSFLTNNPDVWLDIEYNRDLIKVIENLENAIIATGGNL